MNTTIPFAGWITACIPHYGCQRYLRRAVQSLLTQTYPWIRIIILNDGDPRPPWRELADIKDRRVVRFDLPDNGGPFFCSEVARLATPDPYFLIQDADDWSAPRRVEILLARLLTDGADLAVSAQPQVCENPDGTAQVLEVRWLRLADSQTQGEFSVQTSLSHTFSYRAPHHGLFRTATLGAIGGYYGGLHSKWDTLIPNLILMVGTISWTPEPLYFRQFRANSLTHSAETGNGSAAAAAEFQCMRTLYKQCYRTYRDFAEGKIDRPRLAGCIRDACGTYVTPARRAALTFHARRLLERLSL